MSGKDIFTLNTIGIHYTVLYTNESNCGIFARPQLLYIFPASFSDIDHITVEKTGKPHGKYQSALWFFQAKLILKASMTESRALESVRGNKCKQFGI